MRLSPNGTPVAVQIGACVIIEDARGRVLMEKREDDGTWCFPGGRIEVDETVEEAARREVWEECGIHVGEVKLFGVFSGGGLDHVYPNGNEIWGIDIVYTSTDFSGDPHIVDGEVTTMDFFPLDGLPQPICPMHTQQVAAYLAAKQGQ